MSPSAVASSVEPLPRSAPLESAFSFAAFAGSLVLNYWAAGLAERFGQTAHTSPDLLLKVLPIVDVRGLYLWGMAVFIAGFAAEVAAFERARAAYIARGFALLIAARSVLMLLTPMRIPDGSLPVDGLPLYQLAGRFLTVRHDLFFSLHTAAPFLGGLLLRRRPARLACLAFSALMGATVLLGRFHYSIDVAGAYLAAYSLYRAQRVWLEPALRRSRATCASPCERP